MEGTLDDHGLLSWRRFMIAVKRLADSLSYGSDRSTFLGSGIEYVQSRPYEFGDSVRSIDWRVTARTGKFFVKQYEAPKCLPCYLLLDTSASMTISSQPRSKYAQAVHIAGGLAMACLDRVSPVGLVGVGSEPIRINPSLSKHQVMQWLHRLRRFRFDETTSLSSRIGELLPMLAERALVIVLSDLHDQQALSALRRLNQAHDCVVLQMQDPAERELRGGGIFRAQESETGRAFVGHGRQQWIDQERIERELKRGGVDHLLICTERPFAQRLRYFFQSRSLLGRGSR